MDERQRRNLQDNQHNHHRQGRPYGYAHRRSKRRRRSGLNPIAAVIIVAAAVILIVSTVVIAVTHKPDIVRESVELEAGSELPQAKAFLKKSGYEIEYAGSISIDTKIPGEYKVRLKSGWHSYEARLIVKDTKAPVIVGASDIIIPVGEGVSYKSGVTVLDNTSSVPELEVDASQVNLNKVGLYPVVYSATDASGNTASVTVTLTVRAKTEGEMSRDRLYALADAALASCVTDDMSDYDKLWAIYCYISQNIAYVDDAETTDEVEEGINGFVKRKGSCFTYFAAMKAMLEREGFQTTDVVRDNEKKEGHHYWSLVKYEGEWYHIDATPRGPEDGREHLVFLLTDAQIALMNAAYNNYWAYQKEAYPASGLVSPYHDEPLP